MVRSGKRTNNLFTPNRKKSTYPLLSKVDTGLEITGAVAQNLSRPINVIMDSVEAGAQISVALAPKASLGLFTLFTSTPAPVLSTLSKVSIVMAPITVAIDIAALVYAYMADNPSINTCNEAIEELEKRKSYLQERLTDFRKLISHLNQRLLQNEEEQRRLAELENEQRQLVALEIEQRRLVELEKERSRRLESCEIKNVPSRLTDLKEYLSWKAFEIFVYLTYGFVLAKEPSNFRNQ